MTTTSDVLRSAGRAAFAFLLARGILAIIFGLLALFSPVSTLKALIFVFGIFSIVDGLISIFAGFVLRAPSWGWVVFNGVLGIVIGVIALRHPQTAALAMVLVIAAWSLASGFFHVYGSFQLKSLGEKGWYWTLLSGLVSISLGVLFVAFPVPAVATLVLLIGIYALVYGVTLIFAAFSARSLAKQAV